MRSSLDQQQAPSRYNHHHRNLSDESDESDDDDYIKRRRREKLSDEEESPMAKSNHRPSPVRSGQQQHPSSKNQSSPIHSSYGPQYGNKYNQSSFDSSNYQKRKRSDSEEKPPSPSSADFQSSLKKKKIERDEWDDEIESYSTYRAIILMCEEDRTDEAIVSKLKEVAGLICNDLQDDYQTHIPTISDIVMQCITDFPVKTAIYCTLVALVNKKIPKFGECIIQLTVEHIIQSHNHYDWIRLKALFRFIFELMRLKLVSENDAYYVFDKFVDLALKYSNDIMGMNYMYTILGSLPWGIEIFKENSVFTSELTTKLTKYFDVYSQFDFTLYKVFKGQKDCLMVMWEQFKFFLSDQTETKEIKSLLKPHLLFPESDLADARMHKIEFSFDEHLIDVGSHENVSKGCIFKGRLGLYEEMMSSTLHLLSPIDRLVIEEYITDLLYFFNGSHRDCVSRLYAWAGDLATAAFTNENKDNKPKSLEEKELAILNDLDPSGEYFQHMAIDVILGVMCLLPSPPVKIHFYNVVVIGMCLQKCTKDNFSREIVKKYINYVFEKIDMFDDECCMQRFTSLMSYYLSHFDCKWDWENWTYILNDPNSTSNKKREQFIRLVLQRTLHVTYMNKVKRSIKGSSNLTEDKFDEDLRYNEDEDLTGVPFAKFLPNAPDANFRFSSNCPHSDDSSKILEAIRQKKDTNEMLDLLGTLQCKDDKILLLDMFLSCALFISSQKNLTEFSDLLSRYKEVIKQLIDHDTVYQRVNLIRSLWLFWFKSPQRIILFMKKLLLQHDIVNAQSVANFLFTDKSLLFSFAYSWDIMKSCIDAQIVRALRAYEYGNDSICTSDTIPKLKKDPNAPEEDYLDKVTGLESTTFKMLIGEIRETVYIMTRLVISKLLSFEDMNSWEFTYVSGVLREIARFYQFYVLDFTGYVSSVLSEYPDSAAKEYINNLFNGSKFFKHASTFVPGGFKATVPRYERRFTPIPTLKNYTILDTRNSIHDLLIQEIRRVEHELPVSITSGHPLCSVVLTENLETMMPVITTTSSITTDSNNTTNITNNNHSDTTSMSTTA
ncbi:hypothetical protein FDP41_003117 [Naegleria fowleri]|uniref:MIF4G domain-containing protein n=1 Tax=Naegleria fowleri TaxID=5763 RepID=A0A6A5BWU5_NAEFO|nr:uncharacterized protein FDP41_003117 [Naegleria fowleri]KAF0977795.1 hypothetical protein FDP41_003117 [Naegleria fowleri]